MLNENSQAKSQPASGLPIPFVQKLEKLNKLLNRYNSAMEIIKENVPFDEVLADYHQEHNGWEGYEIGLIYLNASDKRYQGKWTLVLLSSADIASVMLPSHNHPIEVIPPSGLSVSEAAQRLKALPKDQMSNCWKESAESMSVTFHRCA
jgi:hypothetical protein